MFSGISKTLWVSALTFAAFSSVAYAQEQPNLEEFKERMAQAGAMAKEDLDEALRQYLEIHVRFSGPEIDYSVGRAYQRLGQCKDALSYYSKIMSYVPDTHPIFTRTVGTYDEISTCENWQKVVLSCDMTEGSYIMLDNDRVNTCWSRPISLADGEHVIKLVSADGKKEVVKKITAKSGKPDIKLKLAFEKEKVEVVKKEAVEKNYVLKERFDPALYWGLIAGGAVIASTSGVFFGLAHRSNKDEVKYADLYAISGDPNDAEKAKDARDKVKSYKAASYTLLSIGCAAAVTGAVLAVLSAVSDKEMVPLDDGVTATIVPSSDGFAVGLGWRF